MDWSQFFEFVGKVASVLAAIAGGWWAIEKWRKRDEHFPRVYFEVTVNFLGRHEEQLLVELVSTLENKGVVPLKVTNLTFKLLGLTSTDKLARGGKEIRGQIQFPHLLQEGTFIPTNWAYTFIYPGVKTEYNFVAAIPDSVICVRMQGDFEYLSTGRTHHAAKVLKVPPGQDPS